MSLQRHLPAGNKVNAAKASDDESFIVGCVVEADCADPPRGGGAVPVLQAQKPDRGGAESGGVERGSRVDFESHVLAHFGLAKWLTPGATPRQTPCSLWRGVTAQRCNLMVGNGLLPCTHHQIRDAHMQAR